MPGLGYDLADIVEGIWLSLFEIRVTPEDPASLAGRRAPTSAGIVHISGAWEGSVAVQCAESLTDRLLPTTVGDLARMIGEGFQTLVPGPGALSAPETAIGTDFRLQVPNAAQVLQSAFRAGDQVFSVTIFQRLPVSAAG